jgi:hypothetical protein
MRPSIVAILAALPFSAAASAAPFPPAPAAPAAAGEYQLTHNYQQFLTTTCSYEGDCALAFPATTAGTLILNVSCGFSLTAGMVASATLESQDFTSRAFLPIFSYSSPNSYAINAPTYLYFAKGKALRIDVFSNGGEVQNLICTISGYQR